jgi:hypothetical protein
VFHKLASIPLVGYVESLHARLLYLTFLVIAIGDLSLFMEADVNSVEHSSRAIQNAGRMQANGRE